MGLFRALSYRSDVSICLTVPLSPCLSLSTLRTQLCQAIVSVADRQDRSPSLLRTLVNSLLNSFSPYEITDKAGQSACSAALMRTVDLSKRGYLAGSPQVAQSLGDLISAYTVVYNVSLPEAQEERTLYPVNEAVRAHRTKCRFLVRTICCCPHSIGNEKLMTDSSPLLHCNRSAV